MNITNGKAIFRIWTRKIWVGFTSFMQFIRIYDFNHDLDLKRVINATKNCTLHIKNVCNKFCHNFTIFHTVVNHGACKHELLHIIFSLNNSAKIYAPLAIGKRVEKS